MVIHLGAPLPAPSSNQPGSTDGQSLTLPYLVLLLVGFTWHPASPPDPVSSYLTLSPLPPYAKASGGGLLSVALSLGLPPLDVIQHHALWSPDFPPPPSPKATAGGGHLVCFGQKLKTSSMSYALRSKPYPAWKPATAAVPKP